MKNYYTVIIGLTLSFLAFSDIGIELKANENTEPIHSNVEQESNNVELRDSLKGCRQAAIKKLKEEAKGINGVLIEESVRVSAVDDRPTNPIKYVWFKGTVITKNGTEELQVMTQKPLLRSCF